MGRKKIEIRPLLDERNRNVTFLKRKAGLMKKAWELSVLCGADVSILIFSNNGKPYEFSSSELDKELDRYLDYEGLIERRRAPEFAAMAAAGEDSDDDDDAGPSNRRGSDRRDSAAAPAQGKSLKGKETFKARMSSRAELARAAADRKDGAGKHRSKKRARKDDGIQRSFIGELTRDSSESEEDDVDEAAEEQTRAQQVSRSQQQQQQQQNNLSSMQYAMNMHAQPVAGPSSQSYSPYPGPSHLALHPNSQGYMQQPPNGYTGVDPNYPINHQRGFQTAMSQPGAMMGSGMANYMVSHGVMGSNPMGNMGMGLAMGPGVGATAGGGPPGMAGMQWDPQLLARYAEFQLQQSHQRQQRALLDRQRQQLAELGIPVDDKSLLDQLFGKQARPRSHSSQTPAAHAHTQPHSPFVGAGLGLSQEYGGASTASMSETATRIETPAADQPFEWPVVNNLPPAQSHGTHGHASRGMQELLDGISTGGDQEYADAWTTGGDADASHSDRYAQRGLNAGYGTADKAQGEGIEWRAARQADLQ